MTLSLFRPTTVGHDYPGATWQDLTSQAAPCQVCAAAEPAGNERDFFIEILLVRIYFIIKMIW